jgi:hypothetical protein
MNIINNVDALDSCDFIVTVKSEGMHLKTVTAQFSAIFLCMTACDIDCHQVHFIRHVENSHPFHVCNNIQNPFLSELINMSIF